MFVRKFPRHILITLLTAALILAACNVGAAPAPTTDINAINTAIVGTTIAQLSVQFTQTVAHFRIAHRCRYASNRLV
jgi:hypothetical protein